MTGDLSEVRVATSQRNLALLMSILQLPYAMVQERPGIHFKGNDFT
jgi:hypothetical protein